MVRRSQQLWASPLIANAPNNVIETGIVEVIEQSVQFRGSLERLVPFEEGNPRRRYVYEATWQEVATNLADLLAKQAKGGLVETN